MEFLNVKITLSPLAVGDILGPELVKGISSTEKKMISHHCIANEILQIYCKGNV